MDDPDLVEQAARVMDPVAFDERAVAATLGQRFDRVQRQMVAREHARALVTAGMLQHPHGPSWACAPG